MPHKFEPPERQTKYGAGPETKGGGYHGGPKRWTGRGPAPARHIPWPEIFKHHISLIEGHLKMVDMVRKHTVEGTGNWNMISQCVDRAREMLWEAKNQAKTFVRIISFPNFTLSNNQGAFLISFGWIGPPTSTARTSPPRLLLRIHVPRLLPADHEYGKAAEEYGIAAAEMRRQGIEPDTGVMEYQLGQAKGGLKRKSIAEVKDEMAAKKASEGSGSDAPNKKQKQTNGANFTPASAANAVKVNGTATDAPTTGADGELFFVDTKPTPVNLSEAVHQPPKRSGSPEPAEPKKNKKAKKKHDGALPAGEGFEDIDEEVNARLEEKEEKKKGKEKKKRKRESNDSNVEAPPAEEEETTAVAATDKSPAAVAKPKKKKNKKGAEEAPGASPEETKSKKRRAEENVGADADAEEEDGGEGKKKAKKRAKKSKIGEEEV